MKKKKLNRRQLWRIQKMQDDYAARAKRRHSHQEQSTESNSLGPEQRGVVISHFGQQLDIEALEGTLKGEIFRCHQRSNLEPLVAGDNVVWQPGEPLGVVVAQLARSSVIKRPSPYGDLRPIAANIDLLIIVIAPQPQPFANLIDRYLVAAENCGIKPILLLNKTDLLVQSSHAEMDALINIYKQIDYQVLQVSSKSTEGLPLLHELLNNRTSVFVGQSGVGKSALINALLPGVNTLEGALSEGTEKGRHTTTSARLFHFPEGGDLIDSPGIREFGLWHMEPEQLLQGFIEFLPYIHHCKFRDCKHEQEPGCRLAEAIQEGEVSPKRMDSYRQILNSLDELH